jgi:hypothetical protein
VRSVLDTHDKKVIKYTILTKNVALNVVPLRVLVRSTLFNHRTTFFRGLAIAVPLSIHAEHMMSELDIVPREGVGDDAVSDSAFDDGGIVVGYDYNLEYPSGGMLAIIALTK